jgi:hypothetical protein
MLKKRLVLKIILDGNSLIVFITKSIFLDLVINIMVQISITKSIFIDLVIDKGQYVLRPRMGIKAFKRTA